MTFRWEFGGVGCHCNVQPHSELAVSSSLFSPTPRVFAVILAVFCVTPSVPCEQLSSQRRYRQKAKNHAQIRHMIIVVTSVESAL